MSDDLPSLHHSVIGLDVHQAKINACWIHQNEQGEKTVEHREFGGFQRDRRALAQWAAACHPEIVVMESTGIYWRSPYAATCAVLVRRSDWPLGPASARATTRVLASARAVASVRAMCG